MPRFDHRFEVPITVTTSIHESIGLPSLSFNGLQETPDILDGAFNLSE